MLNVLNLPLVLGSFRFYDEEFCREDEVDEYEGCNDADPRGLKIEDLMASLKAHKINYFFLKIDSCTDKMIREFCSAAGQVDFVHCLDLKKPSQIFDAVIEIVKQSTKIKIKETMNST